MTDGRIVACLAIAESAAQLDRAVQIELRDLWRSCLADTLWAHRQPALRRALVMIEGAIARDEVTT